MRDDSALAFEPRPIGRGFFLPAALSVNDP